MVPINILVLLGAQAVVQSRYIIMQEVALPGFHFFNEIISSYSGIIDNTAALITKLLMKFFIQLMKFVILLHCWMYCMQ